MSLAHPQTPEPAEVQNPHRHAELDSASHPRTPNTQHPTPKSQLPTKEESLSFNFNFNFNFIKLPTKPCQLNTANFQLPTHLKPNT